MTKQEFQKAMSVLISYYPHVSISSENLKAYWLKFRDVNADEFANAVNSVVNESEFFPSVATIIKYIQSPTDQFTLDNLRDDIHAIIQVPTGQGFSLKDYNPITKKVVRELGGKFSLGQMSEDVLEMKIRRAYKYAIKGIEYESNERIERTGNVHQIGDVLEQL